MNLIVGMMAAGAKKAFSKEEYRTIRQEADTLFKQLTKENSGIPPALRQHTSMNIFPAIAVYKTLTAHGMQSQDAVNVIGEFFNRICRIMFTPVSWFQHIGGMYHRYPSGMVRHSLRDFSPDAGFVYRLPKHANPAAARFDITACPYTLMCRKYDCLELNPAFCNSDDAKYGRLHKNLKWARTGTIGKGSECCDFRIIDIQRCPDYKEPAEWE